jgi:uncharacterized protein
MSGAKLPQDPSMEEIIASIGRVLAEDGGPRASVPPPAAADDDILELTEALAADGSVRRVEPKLAAPDPPPDGNREPDASRLMSAAAAEAASAAFARLPHGIPGAGAPTLEDIVRDALRPLLQHWLDEHLPALVERLVRDEITRIAGDPGRR